MNTETRNCILFKANQINGKLVWIELPELIEQLKNAGYDLNKIKEPA